MYCSDRKLSGSPELIFLNIHQRIKKIKAKPLKSEKPDFCSRLQFILWLGLAGFLALIPTVWADGSASLGKTIYQNACADCHEGGFWGWLSGAPSIKDASQWKPYLEKDVESIIQAAIQGTDGGMNPKGDCGECTDEEIRKAVEYMLSVVES